MKQILKIETIEFIYDSEEERESHRNLIELCGYECSGQVRIDLNRSLQNPDYHWYGKYTKYTKCSI